MRVNLLDGQEIASNQNLPSVDLRRVDQFSIQANVTTSSPAVKTFDTGTAGVATITFDTQENTDPGDYIVIYDFEGTAWAVAADTTGSDEEPTGAIWAAIPAANKAQADISGDTSAADVADAFETAFNGLTGFTDVVTLDDSANDGTMTVTQDDVGVVTDPVPKNEDDSGAGSITAVEDTAGVDNEFSITDNTITISDHGYQTGLKVAASTDTTLPTGLSATDYYVIKVDDDTIKLASSQANAVAGTAVDITGNGDGTHTLTPAALSGASIKAQGSNDATNWVDISSASANITATGSSLINVADVGYRYARPVITIAAGQFTATVRLAGKERPVR